ncbi:MAG: TOBE domain-containing protein, partial [Pseudomonadota bacterium]|nr:TOBE domain-containing protein [Pseudomonadota bacterium]
TFTAPGRDGATAFVLRPEAIRIAQVRRDPNDIEAVIEDIVFLGSDVRIVLALADGRRLAVRSGDPQGVQGFTPGMPIHAGFAAEALSEVSLRP